MYILSDIKYLPSANFLKEDNCDYKDVIEIFAKRACILDKFSPKKSLICDEVHDDEELVSLLSDLVKRKLDEWPSKIKDFKQANTKIRKFMLEVIATLNGILFEHKNWHFAQESILTQPHFLKAFVPVFYRDGDDIWAELAIVMFGKVEYASDLFFEALRLWNPSSAEYMEDSKETLFDKLLFERELIITMLRHYKIPYIVYDTRQPLPGTFYESPPLCLGYFKDYTRIMVYHGPLVAPNTQSMEENEPSVSHTTDPENSASQASTSGPQPVPVPQTKMIFGREMKVVNEPELVKASVLHNLSKLSSDYENRVHQHGHVRFRISDMAESTTTVELNTGVGMGFGVQDVINLKRPIKSKKTKDLHVPFLLLDTHDKYNVTLDQVVQHSHQLQEGENIITTDESGLNRLLSFKKGDKERFYLYNKGEPNWSVSQWKEYARIFASQLNDFLCNLFQVKGVNVPYIYISGGISFFQLHSEDGNLKSLNVCILGSGKKCWFFIPRRYHNEFRKWLLEVYLKQTHQVPVYCPNLIQHKCLFILPADIPPQFEVFFVEQNLGEFVLVDSAAFHQGFNTGPNISFAFNFGTKDWIPTYTDSRICKMNFHNGHESVYLDEKVKKDRKIVKYRELHPTKQLPAYDEYADQCIRDNLQESTCDVPIDTMTLINYIKRFEDFPTRLRTGPLYGDTKPMSRVDLLCTQFCKLTLSEPVTQQEEFEPMEVDELPVSNEERAIFNEMGITFEDPKGDQQDDQQESDTSAQDVASPPNEEDKDEPEANSSSAPEVALAKRTGLPKRKPGPKPTKYLEHCDASSLSLNPPVYKCIYCTDKPFETKDPKKFSHHYGRVHISKLCSSCLRWYSDRNFTPHKRLHGCTSCTVLETRHTASCAERNAWNIQIDKDNKVERKNVKLTPEEKAAREAAKAAKKPAKKPAKKSGKGGRKRRKLEESEEEEEENVQVHDNQEEEEAEEVEDEEEGEEEGEEEEDEEAYKGVDDEEDEEGEEEDDDEEAYQGVDDEEDEEEEDDEDEDSYYEVEDDQEDEEGEEEEDEEDDDL